MASAADRGDLDVTVDGAEDDDHDGELPEPLPRGDLHVPGGWAQQGRCGLRERTSTDWWGVLVAKCAAGCGPTSSRLATIAR